MGAGLFRPREGRGFYFEGNGEPWRVCEQERARFRFLVSDFQKSLWLPWGAGPVGQEGGGSRRPGWGPVWGCGFRMRSEAKGTGPAGCVGAGRTSRPGLNLVGRTAPSPGRRKDGRGSSWDPCELAPSQTIF